MNYNNDKTYQPKPDKNVKVPEFDLITECYDPAKLKDYRNTENLISITGAKTPQSLKEDIFTFYYPRQKGKWSFQFPWQTYNGWFSWFYRKWESVNKNDTNKWVGRIILGFKKIDREWLVTPEEALKEHNKGKQRLINYLEDIIKNPDLDDNIEDTRLFK